MTNEHNHPDPMKQDLTLTGIREIRRLLDKIEKLNEDTFTITIEDYLNQAYEDLEIDAIDPDGYRKIEIKGAHLNVRGQVYYGRSIVLVSFVPASGSCRWLYIILDDSAGQSWDRYTQDDTTRQLRPRPAARMRLVQSA